MTKPFQLADLVHSCNMKKPQAILTACQMTGQSKKQVLKLVLVMVALWATPASMAINPVLDINGTFPYLVRPDGRIIEPQDYMDFDNIYTPNDTYRLKQTAQGRNYHLLKAFDFANYFQSDYWHYSKQTDLVQSAQPVANVSECALQLDWLERQLNRTDAPLFKSGEQHINLMTVLDSFGHPEAATYDGHGYWLGSYHQCRRASLDLQRFNLEECLQANNYDKTNCPAANEPQQSNRNGNKPVLNFRYCLGKAHDRDWPRDDNYMPRISYKVGLCLPESCETLTYQRGHASQIERLMRFNLPAYHRERIHLHDLYCLPDERSPIRQLSLSARIFLTVCTLWLGLMVLSTCAYSCYKRHQSDLREILVTSDELHRRIPNANSIQLVTTTAVNRNFAHSNGNNQTLEDHTMAVQNHTQQHELTNSDHKQSLIGIPPALSCGSPSLPIQPLLLESQSSHVVSNSSLSGYSTKSSRSTLSAWIADSPGVIRLLQALSLKETLKEFQRPPRLLNSSERKLRVNLNALDAIKCLCCILVIFGHIIFIHMQHLSNIVHTIELSHEIYPRALIAFFNFVDTFFIISGMLTAYFIFKRFNAKSFSSPFVWLSVILLRFLRLSPVYVLVFWFIKTTSVYLTHGPIWDYGTDKNSMKGLCINDHWWKSILYFGNLNTMQPLCILPAWSIIVDAQYSLVMPLLIYLIFKNKRAGYLLLVLATIVSTTKMTIQLANQTAVKTSDMAKIRLHVYPLISRFAAEFYNDAWNRIGPVAIGIFGGHMLYLYEISKIRRWPIWMYGYGFKLVLALHVLIFLLPTIGRFIDDPKSTSETDTTIFILSNATIKPIWSVINTIFLLRLITDLRRYSVLARIMSHNLWHCLGKLCFTSYLIHYEIILVMLKSRQEGLIDPNWSNAFREFSAVFLISTLISYIIYILYEAPVNKLIMLAFTGRTSKSRPESEAGESGDAAKTTDKQPFPANNFQVGDNHEGKPVTLLSNGNIMRPDIDYSNVSRTKS